MSKEETLNKFWVFFNYHYNIWGWMSHINDSGLSTAATDRDIYGMELLDSYLNLFQ